ncbi:MAG: HNH endonuclease signature motif containing protein [Bacteroidota bacterium]
MPNLPRKNRHQDDPEQRTRERKPSGNQRFYNRKAWRATRKAYIQSNPLCEVCSYIGRTEAADVVDHLIAISQGGSEYDSANLMAMCHRHHNQKSALELRGQLLVSIDTEAGKIPKDRSDVYAVLCAGAEGDE